jgi:hypothetical protein
VSLSKNVMPSKAGILLLEMPAAVLCVLKCPAGVLEKIHPGFYRQTKFSFRTLPKDKKIESAEHRFFFNFVMLLKW